MISELSGTSEPAHSVVPASMIPDSYAVGDRLKWDAPWAEVRVWTELPFWLMVDNCAINVQFEGHSFPIEIQDNYFELYAGAAADSGNTVLYRGPYKERKDLSLPLQEAIASRPEGPYMWRKCKTYLKVGTRCNEDVLQAMREQEAPRRNEASIYLSELCRAHIPVINKLIQSYRVATYDYFAFEVSPWEVPHWSVERSAASETATLVSYRDWDVKPFIYDDLFNPTKRETYQLIQSADLSSNVDVVPTPGELELLDALNLMERGDYSGAVRRVTTAIEVVVEDVTGKAVEAARGKVEAERFLKATRMRFDERVKEYQNLSARTMRAATLKILAETRKLRHRIVHGGYRIGPDKRGEAQKAVDTGRWMFNWFENDVAKKDIREKRIAYRSLGRDLSAGMFRPRITAAGVVLTSIRDQLSKAP